MKNSIRIRKQIGEMVRKINLKCKRNKYKELHVGKSISGTNDEAGDNSFSASDGEVIFLTSSM